MKLYLICLLISMVAADAKRDGGFEVFCGLDWLSSSHDAARGADRYNKDGDKATCKQTYALPLGFSKEAAVEMCYEKTPFHLNQHLTEASFKGNDITCHWESSAQCELSAVLIGQKCYRMETSDCPASWKMAKIGGSMFTWLPHFFGEPVVKFENSSRKRPLPNTVFHRGYMHRNISEFKNPKGPVLAVLVRFPVSGVYTGDYVHLYDPKEPNIMTLCEQKGDGVSQPSTGTTTGHLVKDPKPKESGTAATAYSKLCASDNSWCMTAYRNLFQPKLKNGLVDMRSFHEFCAKQCQECYAASDFHYKEAKDSLPNGRYYVPIANTKGVDGSTDCQVAATQGLANKFNQIRKNVQTVGTDMDDYIKGYPSNRCADGGRRAVQYYKAGNTHGLMDAPVFDRLPLYCVTGSSPPAPKGGKCRKNAIQNGPNCICKTLYHDALDEEDVRRYAASLGAVRGEACIRDGKEGQTCTTSTSLKYHYEAVMLLIDDSGSVEEDAWNHMLNFVNNAYTWIPNNLKIMLCRYSSEDYCLGLARIDSGWNQYSYQLETSAAMQPRSRYGTSTYGAMYSFVTEWTRFRNKDDSKALMFVITDGDAGDRGKQKESIEHARYHNVHIKAIPVGTGIGSNYFDQDVVNPAEDIIPIDNYGNLQEKLMENIKTEMCVYEKKHVDEAMQYSQ